MTKKGPLSKAEQFFIEQKYSELDLNGLCKELDRAKGIVEKHIKGKKLTKGPSDDTQRSLLAEQFGYQGGSTIMTPNASEMGDSLKKRSFNTPKTKQCTTSIRRQKNE